MHFEGVFFFFQKHCFAECLKVIDTSNVGGSHEVCTKCVLLDGKGFLSKKT